MLTIGVDLSAEEPKTWMATLAWHANGAELIALAGKVGNKQIVEAAKDADKVGIDSPFGWPMPFLDFVREHMAGHVTIRDGEPIAWRRDLAYRATDRFVTAHTGLRPLSVSADRIAHAAMRCAALLSAMSAAGLPLDRSGRTGIVAEVYPAAALKVWGLTHRGYKHAKNATSLDTLLSALRAGAPWLDLGIHESVCRQNDDAFDAVVAALNARAAGLALTVPPPAGQAQRAAHEGWIALPAADSLTALVNGR